jgi:hypothetical protein
MTQPPNNPVYHRRVACDQTISLRGQRYSVPFEIGALVLVERLLSQNALRIQPLHEGRPNISASSAVKMPRRPAMPKTNSPGFHRRLNRTRSKPASRLPDEVLRFIAQSPTIPFGAYSPRSGQLGKPADNGPNQDEAQGS